MLSFFDVHCLVLCVLCFSLLTLRIPTSLGAGSGKQICWGKWLLSTFWAPMQNVSPGRLQHVQINLHPFYMEPLRKRRYFLQTEQNSTLLTCLLSPAAEGTHFGRQRRAGRKPRSLSSCNRLLWQWRLPADKWSISPHVQVLRAYRCPGRSNQFPAGSFVLGFALTVDILGQWCQMSSSFSGSFKKGLLSYYRRKASEINFRSWRRTGARYQLWLSEVCGSEALNEPRPPPSLHLPPHVPAPLIYLLSGVGPASARTLWSRSSSSGGFCRHMADPGPAASPGAPGSE